MTAQAPPDPEVQAAAEKARKSIKKLRDVSREALQAAAQLEDLLVGKGIALEVQNDDTTAGAAGEGDAR